MASIADTPSASKPSVVPGDLGWHLAMVLRGYQTRFEDTVSDLPGGIRGYQVLSTVVHRNPPNQLALASHLGIDRTVMTYLLDTLVKAGLVERIPDPSDRRARKVVPTTKGEGCLADFEQRMAAVERQFLSGLSEREASELESTMHRLAMIVHREQPGASPCEAMDNLP